ncbi:hypothetical protein [Streptomyces netropsis]|uniref:Uncharacterized protein n=1 Tax=Streptomyces netropsis TaxID=55404 RepID=A0A7W7L6K7_STRNE|nr:hypothetical protein [Streptomyces netropsis]MBB4884011.1 hypothetical protein [Streptomyces netropsis]GGR06744.1 hypothetical protein GCM10010219_09050 [Streptomyces netropsis]
MIMFMFLPVFTLTLGLAATAFGVCLAFNFRGLSTALAQYAQARGERVYRRLGGQGDLGGFDGLRTPLITVSAGTARYRYLGSLMAVVGLALSFGSFMVTLSRS